MLSHLVVQNGDTDAAVVETRLTAADGSPSMRMWSSLTLPPGRGSSWKYQSSQDAARELSWMESTRSCERVRRTSAIIASSRGNEAGDHTIFTPIVMSACEAMGPSMAAFLVKEADKFLILQQPALKHSWNTMVASSFWDMRLI